MTTFFNSKKSFGIVCLLVFSLASSNAAARRSFSADEKRQLDGAQVALDSALSEHRKNEGLAGNHQKRHNSSKKVRQAQQAQQRLMRTLLGNSVPQPDNN